jgi:transposase
MEPVRRLEVFTGAGRRTWRDEDKAGIVAGVATSGDSVCAVARRHGYRRSSCLAGDVNCEYLRLDVPRLTGCSSCRQLWMRGSSPVEQRRAPDSKAEASAGTIEVEIDGVTVRVGRGADAKTLMAVLRALKAGT